MNIPENVSLTLSGQLPVGNYNSIIDDEFDSIINSTSNEDLQPTKLSTMLLPGSTRRNGDYNSDGDYK